MGQKRNRDYPGLWSLYVGIRPSVFGAVALDGVPEPERFVRRILFFVGAVFFLLLPGCNGADEENLPCVANDDCPGLWECAEGYCLELCSTDEECLDGDAGVYCVYGGCTDLEYSGPFHVEIHGVDEAPEQTKVWLDGTGSTYVGSGQLTAQWVQLKGSPVTITPEKTPFTASFSAPRVFFDEPLLFKLVLDDGEDSTERQKTVLIRDIVNEVPVIELDYPQDPVREGEFVVLDARATMDPNPGDPIEVRWTQELGPQVSLGELGGTVPGTYLGFVAPPVDSLKRVKWTLQVSDTRGGVSTKEVEILVRDLANIPCVDVSDCITGSSCVWVVCEEFCLESTLDWCCSADRPCDDQNPCTIDRCDPDAGCIREPVPGCCASPDDCPDPGACREAVCSEEGECSSKWTEGCCLDDTHCAQQEVCTASICVDNQCTVFEQPDCCVADEDCETDAACAQAYCDPWTRSCRVFPIPGCCDEDADCVSDAMCIADSCDLETGTCVRETLWGCCSEENQGCVDNDPCTRDLCQPTTGACVIESEENCCRSMADCPDVSPCSEPFCQDNVCYFAVIPDCCDSSAADADLQCDDANSCTIDLCDPVAGKCRNFVQSDCCSDDLDCADGDPCTHDHCAAETRTCQWVPDPGCCTGDEMCDDQNPCTSAECVDGRCDYTLVAGCCSSNHQCLDDDPCTADQCDSSAQCVHSKIESCCVSDEDCKPSAESCTVARCSLAEGRCVAEADPNCCLEDESCPPAGACVLRVCSGGACDSVVLPACCQNDEDCDDADPCTEDSCDLVSLQCENKVDENCCRQDSDCVSEQPCVDAVCDGDPGKCQEIPASNCCTKDEDCASPNPCSIAKCTQGRCAQEPVFGCCFVKDDCTPSDVCETHQCSETFLCEPEPVAGCCSTDDECSDGDPCTDDRCDKRIDACVFPAIPGCCLAEAACDDGDPCTDDQCVDQVCQFTELGASCCSEPLDCDDGDPCTVDICGVGDGQCESFILPSCCFEDADCVSGACGQTYCEPSAQACAQVESAGCCEVDVDCAPTSECETASCVAGACVVSNPPGCCTEASQCDDGEPCTKDSCGDDGRCVHVVAQMATTCDDGNSFTTADQCASSGRCVGFHRWSAPDSMGNSAVAGFMSGGSALVGSAGMMSVESSLWVRYQQEGNPFELQTLAGGGFVDFSHDHALAASGEIYGFDPLDAGVPLLSLSLDEALPNLVASPWSTIATWTHAPTGLIHMLVGGRSAVVAHCVRAALASSWSCEEETVSSGAEVEVGALEIRSSGEAWALVLDLEGGSSVYTRNLTIDNDPWSAEANPGCAPEAPDCDGATVVALALAGQRVYAIGEGTTLLRRTTTGTWEDVAPPLSLEQLSGEAMVFRALTEWEEALFVVGYQEECPVSASDGACLVQVGRWWLFVGVLMEDGALDWGVPQVLFEESCGQGLVRACPDEGLPAGPASIGIGGDQNTWTITGAVWGDQGSRGVIFWKP